MSGGRLAVDVQQLVDHAGRRYEDALICDALRNFISFAGDVPSYAWGKMLLSGQWEKAWQSAIGCREREAATARDVQAATGEDLFKVAADYVDGDVSCILDFKGLSPADDFFRPWLDPTTPTAIVAHPGAYPRGPDYSRGVDVHAAIPSADGDVNDLDTRIAYAATDHTTTWIEAQGTVSVADQALKYFDESPGRHALHAFVDTHGGAIRQAEQIVKQLGLSTGQLPMEDFIDQAFDASPNIIANRAELINGVGAAWGDRSADMTAQTNALLSYWDSPGAATAYFYHANRCIKYYDTLKVQAAWLGSEGKKAASAIDNLQLAYANAGKEEINDLITKLHAYLDAADDLTGSVDKPAKALVAAVSDMANLMLADWKQTNDDYATTLQIDQAAHNQQPDLGDASHRAQPFPDESGTPRYDSASSWAPKRGGPRVSLAPEGLVRRSGRPGPAHAASGGSA